jgi:NADPH-dependent 2,4-dienoyl-CoA reductase/sulfur reductase-like enzyme
MTEPVHFTIDGRPAEAEAGVSLLAALWNDGRRALRTSVTGQARGPLCGMGTCFECRVTLDGIPHVRSCLTTLRPGMDARLLATSPLAESAAGAAPVGSAERLEAEVVVVGGGPAGLAAAVHAAEAGARTLLVDTHPRPGGQIWRHRGEPPAAANDWIARLGRARVTPIVDATVVDAADRELLIEHEGRPRRVRFSRLVLATGARELFLPFPGWTLPGVVGVGGAQAMLKAGARFSGRRVVVAGSGPLLLAVAAALAKAGARVVGLAEQAPLGRLTAFGAGLWRTPRKIAEGLDYGARLVGVPCRAGAWVRDVEVRGGALRARLTDGRREWTWDCDMLACGYGLVPNLELPRLLGCETSDARVVLGAAQQTSVAGIFAAGELGGIAGVDHALVTGAIAGLAAAGRPNPKALTRRRDTELAFGARLARAFALRDELRGLARPDTPVCRCEDVAHGRLEAVASSREAKLATRAGMGPCQGRVCGPALGFLRGWPTDTTRPPLTPTPFAVLAEEPADASAAAGETQVAGPGSPAHGPRHDAA